MTNDHRHERRIYRPSKEKLGDLAQDTDAARDLLRRRDESLRRAMEPVKPTTPKQRLADPFQ